MKKKTLLQIDPNSVHVRLGMCAAALVGTAAAVPNADATIVTFNVTLPIPATTAGVYINLLTGATGSSSGSTPGWDFNPYNAAGNTQLGFYWATTAGGVATTTATGPYLDLPVGSVISSGSTFTRAILGTTGSPFLLTGTHILGLQFLNETTGVIDFGYLTMTNTASNGFPATILSWSFDNTGAAITVVPEPSTIALLTVSALAAGAVGLREWRRKRAA